MRSVVAKRILDNTPQEVRDKVRQYGNELVNKKVEYRKHKSGRLFYRIENETVTKVLRREKSALIEVVDNWIVVSNATDYDTVKCTEQEFNTAYQEALQRIKEMKC